MKNIKLILGLILLLVTMGCEKFDNSTICSDEDGNIYKTIQIGDQLWMAENLCTTTLNDGTFIFENRYNWSEEIPYYCHISNQSNIKEILYNWYAVNTNKLCPNGWRVPTDEDWKILERHIGMSIEESNRIGWRGTNEGEKLKATFSWTWGNNGIDTYGFSATAPGFKFATDGNFYHVGEQTDFWTSTSYEDPLLAMRRSLIGYSNQIYRNITYKNNGFSVRCIKNN